MIAVVVHKMVSIAAKLIPQLLYNSSDFLLGEVCTANLYTLSLRRTEKIIVDRRDFLIGKPIFFLTEIETARRVHRDRVERFRKPR